MIPQNDFAGKNGQTWFVGVVENRNDPAKAGRLQVRMFGWHDEDLSKLPTEELPWSQTSLPVNASRNSSMPKEGEWVHGFFFDGPAGQQPIVTGVISGIISETPKVPTGASDELAALEISLNTETAKLNLMLASSRTDSVKSKIDDKSKQILLLDKKLSSAIIVRDRLQTQFDSATSLSKQSIGISLTQQNTTVSDLQLSISNLTVELNTLNKTYTPKQIEDQKAVVARIQSDIDTLNSNLNRKSSSGFKDVATQADVETRPKPIDGVQVDRKDQPIVPALGREIKENTGLDISDKNREHVCAVADYIRSSNISAQIGASVVAQEIRKAIKAVMKALSSSPGSSAITEQLKTLSRELKRATDFLNEISDYTEAYNAYINKIKAIIDYIAKLPAELVATFKKCLSEAYVELAKAFRQIVGDLRDSGTDTKEKDANETVTAFKTVMTDVKTLATTAVKVYDDQSKILTSLSTNTTPLTDAQKKELISGLFPDSQEHDETSFKPIG